MKKAKLILIRKQKGYTQKQVADYIAMDTSNYSRKESGDVNIVSDEWSKIARFLDVTVEDIYESEPLCPEYFEIINNEKTQLYISELEKENEQLREELNVLKSKIEQAKTLLSK